MSEASGNVSAAELPTNEVGQASQAAVVCPLATYTAGGDMTEAEIANADERCSMTTESHQPSGGQEDSLPDNAAMSASHGEEDSQMQLDDDPISSRKEQDSPESRSGRANFRSTSSKIANLRAAFEKDTSTEGQPSRNFARSADRRRERSAECGRQCQDEIGKLRDERDREEEMKIALEEKCTKLEEELEALEQQTHEQKKETRDSSPGQETNGTNGHNHKEARASSAQSDEVHLLQQQLAELKKTISTSTRMSSSVTDSTFAQEMGVLHHELQNWIVLNFRRAKMDIAPNELCNRLEGTGDFERVAWLQQVFRVFDPSAKLAFLQCVATVSLLDVFCAELVFGLREEEQWCADLLKSADSMQKTLGSVAYAKWRAATVEAVCQSAGFQDLLQKAIERVAESICHSLYKLTEIDAGESGKQSLVGIIKRTASLAHLFSFQQAQYQFLLPNPGTPFDAETMEDIAEDGEELSSSVISCVTFPSIIKNGDECGDNTHLRNVIMKSRVLCREVGS
ncbi:hypothetical protein KC332_g5201 [Hortaea werneckii]|uniref:Uncharacterized protein n=1 Tax=Hortaea werneckii TaxID=91943 RepID=A0A3M7J1L6_HORWE|nr:hypothetical protein KC350_g12347 [Hortaea werneckii]KAI6849629.1 hypothetical protein KC358_g1105 [Hortaea werneckii]KAI6934514.1 hypothetical protein KC341_g7559 [Hortaea werneckii]KAI6949486.1 hypothetical protein KC348_g1325 [Hortaea werneckii]KAI6981539.1 hypothetical protein KC321_g1155 [Hortaea werneckii]